MSEEIVLTSIYILKYIHIFIYLAIIYPLIEPYIIGEHRLGPTVHADNRKITCLATTFF